jgi:hypothetical protein
VAKQIKDAGSVVCSAHKRPRTQICAGHVRPQNLASSGMVNSVNLAMQKRSVIPAM